MKVEDSMNPKCLEAPVPDGQWERARPQLLPIRKGIKVQGGASWLSGKSPVQSSVVSRSWTDPGGREH